MCNCHWLLTGLTDFILCCTVNCLLYSIVLYTARYSATLYCKLHCTVLNCTVLHCTVLHCTAVHHSSQLPPISGSTDPSTGEVRKGRGGEETKLLSLWPSNSIDSSYNIWNICSFPPSQVSAPALLQRNLSQKVQSQVILCLWIKIPHTGDKESLDRCG